MPARRTATVLKGIPLGVAFASALWLTGRAVAAQVQGAQTPASASTASQPPTAPARDPYQRSTDIYLMQTSAASGPQRGEEIYYFKCFFCHSPFAKAGSAGPPGPLLKGLFAQPTLRRGQPATDQSVRDVILNGVPSVMPAYRSTLSDADMADLLGYLRSDKCCYEAEEPPPNPRYRAGR